MTMLITLVTLLVTSLVRFLVFVFFEVPLLGVILVMLLVILAFTQALLVRLVFRIILIVSLLLWQRRCHGQDRAARDTGTQRHCQNPHALPQIHSHSHKTVLPLSHSLIEPSRNFRFGLLAACQNRMKPLLLSPIEHPVRTSIAPKA